MDDVVLAAAPRLLLHLFLASHSDLSTSQAPCPPPVLSVSQTSLVGKRVLRGSRHALSAKMVKHGPSDPLPVPSVSLEHSLVFPGWRMSADGGDRDCLEQQERARSERGLSSPVLGPGSQGFTVLVSATVTRNRWHLCPYAVDRQVSIVGLTAGSGRDSASEPGHTCCLGSPGNTRGPLSPP